MSSNSIETHRNSTVHHGSARELAEEIQNYGEYWKYKHVPQAIAKANPWNKQTNHKINKKVNTFMYVISAIFLCPGNHMGTSQTITYLLLIFFYHQFCSSLYFSYDLQEKKDTNIFSELWTWLWHLKNFGGFHLYLFPFDFPFNYIAI